MMPTPPSEYRKYVLPVIEPYDPTWLFGFHGARCLAAIESVSGLQYRRCLGVPAARAVGGDSWLQVSWQAGALQVSLPVAEGVDHLRILGAVRRMFDVDCDPGAVAATLAGDPRLGALLHEAPGLRVPGVWDGFETAVRAILGQQVSVARATGLAGRLIERYGAGRFPRPETLADADPSEVGMPRQRGQAITGLARALLGQHIRFDASMPRGQLTEELLAIPGIGPWTAGYIAMRVARDPDVFLDTDWVVLKQLGLTPAAARRLAERWRPWRSYAVMYLWWAAGSGITC